jgi:hypothetical protein
MAGAGVIGLSVLASANPATSPLFPPCLWRAATGWLCPGCGAARALHALLHGELGVALQMNPLAVAVVPLAAVHVIQIRRRGFGVLTSDVRPFVVRLIAATVVMFGILRNLW